MVKYLVVIAAIFSLILACKKDEANCNNSPWHKEWVRLVYTNEPLHVDSVRVFVKKIKKNSVWFVSDLAFFEPGGYIEICGSQLFKASNSVFNDKQLFYDLNANVGAKWTVTTKSDGGSQVVDIVTLKEKGVTVTVPGGSFTTTVFTMETTYDGVPRHISDLYITDDHGPVRLVGNTIKLELASKNF